MSGDGCFYFGWLFLRFVFCIIVFWPTSNETKTIAIVRSHKTKMTRRKHLISLFQNFLPFGFFSLRSLPRQKKILQLKTANGIRKLIFLLVTCSVIKRNVVCHCTRAVKPIQLKSNFSLSNQNDDVKKRIVWFPVNHNCSCDRF